MLTSHVLMQNLVKRRSSSIKESTLPDNLRRGFERFQRDDGVPVHLKAGLRDVLLYRFTTILVLVGVAQSVYTIVTMAFPAKKK